MQTRTVPVAGGRVSDSDELIPDQVSLPVTVAVVQSMEMVPSRVYCL